MNTRTIEYRLEHLDELTRRVIGSISTLTIGEHHPYAIRDLIDRHRTALEELRTRLAHSSTTSTATRETIERLDKIIEQVIDELDDARARLDAWKWINESSGIVSGVTNDIGVIVSIAIAVFLAHITKI